MKCKLDGGICGVGGFCRLCPYNVALIVTLLPYPILGYVTYSVERYEAMERRIVAESVKWEDLR